MILTNFWFTLKNHTYHVHDSWIHDINITDISAGHAQEAIIWSYLRYVICLNDGLPERVHFICCKFRRGDWKGDTAAGSHYIELTWISRRVLKGTENSPLTRTSLRRFVFQMNACWGWGCARRDDDKIPCNFLLTLRFMNDQNVGTIHLSVVVGWLVSSIFSKEWREPKEWRQEHFQQCGVSSSALEPLSYFQRYALLYLKGSNAAFHK